jgi:hypothetical protein
MKTIFGKIPTKSNEYIRVSVIRTSILFFLLFGFLHVIEMWPGFEDNVLILAVLAIVYHFVVFFVMRRREKALS